MDASTGSTALVHHLVVPNNATKVPADTVKAVVELKPSIDDEKTPPVSPLAGSIASPPRRPRERCGSISLIRRVSDADDDDTTLLLDSAKDRSKDAGFGGVGFDGSHANAAAPGSPITGIASMSGSDTASGVGAGSGSAQESLADRRGHRLGRQMRLPHSPVKSPLAPPLSPARRSVIAMQLSKYVPPEAVPIDSSPVLDSKSPERSVQGRRRVPSMPEISLDSPAPSAISYARARASSIVSTTSVSSSRTNAMKRRKRIGGTPVVKGAVGHVSYSMYDFFVIGGAWFRVRYTRLLVVPLRVLHPGYSVLNPAVGGKGKKDKKRTIVTRYRTFKPYTCGKRVILTSYTKLYPWTTSTPSTQRMNRDAVVEMSPRLDSLSSPVVGFAPLRL